MLLLLACILGCNGGDPCEAYVEAYLGCVSASGEDTTSISPEVLCSAAEKRSDIDDYYDCVAETYASADCSTAEGLAGADEAARNGCTAPTP